MSLCFTTPYSFLYINATVISDNLFRFKKSLLERMQELIMTSDDKIRDEKLNMI